MDLILPAVFPQQKNHLSFIQALLQTGPMPAKIEENLSLGRHVPNDLYAAFTGEDLEGTSDMEKAAAASEFKCFLYNDLIIRVEDIFGDLLCRRPQEKFLQRGCGKNRHIL